MTTETTFKQILRVVLSDGRDKRSFLARFSRGRDDASDAHDPPSPSDVLTLGVLLAMSSSVGKGCGGQDTGLEEVEDALGQAVACRRLWPIRVHSAAILAAEAARSSPGSEADRPKFHVWLQDALPALLSALLRSPSPKAWALAEESARLLAQHATTNVTTATAGALAVTHSAAERDTSDADPIMPLLEALVRAANAASQAAVERSSTASSSSSTNGGYTGVATDAVAARVLAAALVAVPEMMLASPRPWRLLLCTLPLSIGSNVLDSFNAVPLMSAVGRGLARAASVDISRQAELVDVIEQKLQGSIQSRVVGLELLRAVLCAPEHPFSPPDVLLAVSWALHAVSSLPRVHPDPAATPTWLCVSAAAVVVAAAPHLLPIDCADVRDKWLSIRLATQGLTWSHAGVDAAHGCGVYDTRWSPPMCTVRSYLSIPLGERLPVDSVAALLHADLVLMAYVDLAEFRARVLYGGIELGLTSLGKHTNQAGTLHETGCKPAVHDAVEKQGYVLAAAWMVIMANLLQACLTIEDTRDAREHSGVHAEVWGGVSLGVSAAVIRRALLHRLSYMLTSERGIEHEHTEPASSCANRSSAEVPFVAAVSLSLPRLLVSTWLSAVESILAEDEPQTASLANGIRYDVPDVAPQVQASILVRAATAVSYAMGLKKCELGRVSMTAADPRFILRDMVSRGMLQQLLMLAERLAPNTAVASSDAGMPVSTFAEALPDRYRMLAARLGDPQGHGSDREGERDLLPLQAGRSHGRWAEASADTRAAIVAGCFELCTAAARAATSFAMEVSVVCALAAPALHLEAWDITNSDGFTNIEFSDAGTASCLAATGDDARITVRDIVPSRRLAALRWVIARATECTALRATAPALSLGATLLLGLPSAAASACAPMLVTAHASAALWGCADAITNTATGGNQVDDPGLTGSLLQRAHDPFQGQMAGVVEGACCSEPQGADIIIDEMTSGASCTRPGGLERAQRAGLLQTAHHLTLRCNGVDAAISMVADVIQVLSSTTDPISSSAAATATSVMLSLLASHLHSIINTRESALCKSDQSDEGKLNDGCFLDSVTRVGSLIVQTIDAAAMMVNSNRSSLDVDANHCQRNGEVDVLRGVNAAMWSLIISTVTGIRASFGEVNSSANGLFSDVAHDAYQSSGRLGLALEKSMEGNDLELARLEVANLRSHRVALRAASALRGGGELPHHAPLAAMGTKTARSQHERTVAKFHKVHWVDMAAQEPSSGEEFDGDDDDDATFCLHRRGVGFAGWEVGSSKPAANATDNHTSKGEAAVLGKEIHFLVPPIKRRRERPPKKQSSD